MWLHAEYGHAEAVVYHRHRFGPAAAWGLGGRWLVELLLLPGEEALWRMSCASQVESQHWLAMLELTTKRLMQ
jgi:hypothetical protein